MELVRSARPGASPNRGDGPNEMGLALPSVDLGTGRTATAVSASEASTCAVLDNGNVKCWGLNSSGQLGLGDTLPRGDEPCEMGDVLPTVDLGTGRTATTVTAGHDDTSSSSHTCATLDNGQVKCWGYNDPGELGLGDRFTRDGQPGEMGDSLPAVDLGTGRTATAVTAGNIHSCLLLDNGQVKCWGGNHYGQLGLGDTATRGRSPGRTGDSLPGTIELLGALAGTVTDGNGTPLAGTLIAGLAPGNYRAVIVHPLSGQFEYGIDGAAYVDAAVFPVTAGHDAPVDAEL